MLTWQERSFYRALIIAAILEKEGVPFEDWFRLLASLRWGSDFEPVRPQGPKGDLKCDGHRRSDGTIFQCYAPRRSRAPKVAKKMRIDFDGARLIWKERMKRWELVINDREGLDADATTELEALRDEHPDYEINVLGPTALEKLALELSAEDLGTLCGSVLNDSDYRQWHVSYAEIGIVVDRLVIEIEGGINTHNLAPPPVDKIQRNKFDEEIAALLARGNLLAKQVEDFFSRQDEVELEGRIASRLARAYSEMKDLGMDSTHCFYTLLEIAGGMSKPDDERRAIIGVLTYFFNKCDIFERAAA